MKGLCSVPKHTDAIVVSSFYGMDRQAVMSVTYPSGSATVLNFVEYKYLAYSVRLCFDVESVDHWRGC
jgi:hypothetical protein